MTYAEKRRGAVEWGIQTLLRRGLVAKGWTFVVNDAPHRTNLGRCHPRTKTIELRGRALDRDDWKDVVLHEIAHALVFELRGTCRPNGEGPHGQTFIAMCALLGCDARAKRDDTLVSAASMLGVD